jgi:pimeloyl-ACP methyl ester carboxylesterase
MTYITYRLGGYFRRLKLHTQGDPSLPALVCVHGLTRNAHDFDRVAQALSDRFYIVAPDLPGRGGSEWLESAAVYNPASYVEALSHLLCWLNRDVFWLGTSLGGICGMLLASAQNTPIKKLILNDVGPFLSAEALTSINEAVQSPARFDDVAAVESYLRQSKAGFVPMSDEDWRFMAATSHRPLPDGGVALEYDPAIVAALALAEPKDVDLWPFYNAITCPKLVIRGERSKLLPPGLLRELAGQGAETFIVPEAGHAPTLYDTASQAAISTFLGG